MIIGFEEKKIIEKELASKKNIISSDDCVKSKDYFILGILAKYLEKIGISSIIEKKENRIDDYFSKNIFQFICNGYILKKKYILDFGLKKDRISSIAKNVNGERFKFNEKLKNYFLKEYKLNDEELIISNYRKDDQHFTSVVIFKSDFNKDLTKNELLNIFKDDDDLKTLQNVEKEFIIPSIRLNKSMLEPSRNNKDDNKWGKNEKRAGEIYNPPYGWHKYALKVFNRYDNNNNDWLDCKGNSGEWCIGYCPITGINKKIEQTYENDDDTRHPGKKVGIGVYCSSQPKTMEDNTEEININGSIYKVGFMIRLKPDKIRCPKTKDDIWVVNGNDNEFRPYGILIKKNN